MGILYARRNDTEAKSRNFKNRKTVRATVFILSNAFIYLFCFLICSVSKAELDTLVPNNYFRHSNS